MTPGAFFSFLTAAFMMYTPIKRVATANNLVQQALAAAERVFRVLDQPAEPACDRGTKGLEAVREAIELRGVSFRYEGAAPLALHNVTLTVRAGDVLALVGSSGYLEIALPNGNAARLLDVQIGASVRLQPDG